MLYEHDWQRFLVAAKDGADLAYGQKLHPVK
jgi:hypothetical protein